MSWEALILNLPRGTLEDEPEPLGPEAEVRAHLPGVVWDGPRGLLEEAGRRIDLELRGDGGLVNYISIRATGSDAVPILGWPIARAGWSLFDNRLGELVDLSPFDNVIQFPKK